MTKVSLVSSIGLCLPPAIRSMFHSSPCEHIANRVSSQYLNQAQSACRLLRWGSSTVADLASAGSARLDQTWPGLELAQAINPASTSPVPQGGNALQPAITDEATSGSRPSPALKHWASSDRNALPGASLGHSSHGLKSRLFHGVDEHKAVERSGSSIPMLAEAAESGMSQTQAADALQALRDAASKAQLAHRMEAGHQRPVHDSINADALQDCIDAAPDEQNASAALHSVAAAAADRQQPPELHQQQTLLHHRSYQRIARQHSHAREPPVASSEQAASSPQQAQVLRHRHRSRLKLSQGGVYKGIMSLARHRSGRVSPEKTALIPSRQPSGVPSQQPDVGRAAPTGPAFQDRAHATHHMKLKTIGLTAMLRTKGKPVAQGTIKRHRPSLQDMLHQSVESVNACTAQLQEQSLQQQEIQRALQAMTSKTIAMLDHAISAAMQQQHHHTR